jgi:hypothetical protein
VHHLAGPVVGDLADVTQRPQVVLGRRELPGGDRRERRVLAIGGEQPRVVGPARADPPHLADGAGRRWIHRALVAGEHVQVARLLNRVGEVLLGPLHALLQEPVAGQVHRAVPGHRAPGGGLGGQGGGRVAQGPVQLGPRRGETLIGAGDREPHGPPGAADRHVVRQLPARTLAVRSVVADRGGRIAADHVALRAAHAGAERMSGRGQGAADQRRPVVRPGVGHRRRALVPEHQVPAVERARVGQIEGRLARGCPPPRVRREQFGMRVHGQPHGAGAGRQPQPDQAGPPAVGSHVDPLDGQAARPGQAHRGVPLARGEPGGLEPRPVGGEPDAVQQLDGRRPEATHFTADVPARPGIGGVLGAHLVEAVAGDDEPAIAELAALRQGRRRRR